MIPGGKRYPGVINTSHLTFGGPAGTMYRALRHESQKDQHMTTATLERRPAVSPADEAAEFPSIDLEFSSAEEVHEGLDNAVATLIETAAKDAACGILVTRLHPGRYTVALDESVPFGETYENIAA